MNCTCSKNIYPCPIHGNGLPVPEIVNHECIVVRLYRRRRMRPEDNHWAADGKWFCEITRDALHTFTGSDRENKHDALLEATCFLNSTNQKPKEK